MVKPSLRGCLASNVRDEKGLKHRNAELEVNGTIINKYQRDVGDVIVSWPTDTGGSAKDSQK